MGSAGVREEKTLSVTEGTVSGEEGDDSEADLATLSSTGLDSRPFMETLEMSCS